MADWQRDAQALWGDDWIAPMADVTSVNRRTIERWKAGEGAPRKTIVDLLGILAHRSGQDARTMGVVLRRMSLGESAEKIVAETNAVRRCVHRIKVTGAGMVTLRREGDWPPGGKSDLMPGDA